MASLAKRESAQAATLASVVNALGSAEFEKQTLRYLHDRAGAEHYSVYRVRNGEPEFLGGASVRGRHALRMDAATSRFPGRTYAELHSVDEIARCSNDALIVRDEIERTEDPALHLALEHYHIVDRVMLCGRPAEDLYAVAVLKSRETGQFDPQELDELAENADLLIAACARHAALHWDRKRAIRHFESVETIEANLRASDWSLSARERQVSARILYGISACGIALDLGLQEETIATYRKRLYARLRIGGRHELLQRYLSLL